jgi:hypothetical protein
VANARDVTLDIIGRDNTRNATNSAGRNFDRLGRQVEQASKKSEKFSQKMLRGAEKLQPAAQAIGAGLALLAGDAIKNASNAEQSIGATQAVFGKYADQVIKKSGEAAEKYGLSANQYRESSNLIGSLFKNQGVALDQLAGKTDQMVGFAADLAAQFGGSTADAVEALSSAFKGEFDPLERYGISLKQSTINAEAFAVAGVKTQAQFDKLTTKQQAAAQQQATVNLLFKQGKDSVGQFGREIGSASGQAQIAKAKYQDLSAELGAKLLPAVLKLLDAGIKLTDWASKHQAAVVALATALGIVTAAVLALNLAVLANPFGLVVVAIAALAAALVYLWQTSSTARNVMSTAFAAIASAVLKAGELMLRTYKAIVNGVLSMVSTTLKALGKIPGNGWAKRAAKDVDGFKNDVNRGFDTAIKKTQDWNSAVQRMPKIVRLKGEISDLQAKIADAKRRLKDKNLTDPQKAKIRAEISQLEASVARAKARLNSVQSRTVTITVATKYRGRDPRTGSNVPLGSAAGDAWATTRGGAGYRTGGPTQIRMGDTTVDSRVYIDGSILDSRTRTIVRDTNDRSAYRARIGRR